MATESLQEVLKKCQVIKCKMIVFKNYLDHILSNILTIIDIETLKCLLTIYEPLYKQFDHFA